jgi:hypothetical protein
MNLYNFILLLGLFCYPNPFDNVNDYTCFLGSPITIVTIFIASHLGHLAPKSVIFQKAWGVRKIRFTAFLTCIDDHKWEYSEGTLSRTSLRNNPLQIDKN